MVMHSKELCGFSVRKEIGDKIGTKSPEYRRELTKTGRRQASQLRLLPVLPEDTTQISRTQTHNEP